MSKTYYTVHAFAKTEKGGNPAGVVFNADDLTEPEMKALAAHIGFSETAFVMCSNKADFKMRFFTPNNEVDLCGHATIGTFYALHKLGIIAAGKYTQQTKAGILNVEVDHSGTVMMQQALPEFSENPDRELIADSLGVPISFLYNELPVQVVSTGLRDILIPVSDLQTLQGIKPDFQKIEAISEKYNAVGYHIFTLETLYGADAHCRNFAPLFGIPEEAATGTSNGALACYLSRYGRLPRSARQWVFEQGYSMERPSEIVSIIDFESDQIAEVWVGGKTTALTEQNY